jgi:hypothetical protein
MKRLILDQLFVAILGLSIINTLVVLRLFAQHDISSREQINGSLNTTVFRDDFDGNNLNSNNWQVYTNGGIVTVNSGFVTVSRQTAGNSFPYIHSKHNFIPETGNFIVKIGIQYLSVTAHGDGLSVDDNIPSNGSPQGVRIYTLWQDSTQGFLFHDYTGTHVYQIAAPQLDYHTIEFRWLDSTDEYYVDGILVNTVARGDEVPRPSTLWFGNPVVTAHPLSWTSFRIDYIEVVNIDSPTGPPTGHIVSPQDNDTTGPAMLFFAAEAQDNSGTGIKHVIFNVFYGGNWHSAGIDTMAPYEVVWQTPNNLNSQQLQFAIHITDNVDNQTEFAGGIHRVNFFESRDQSNIAENWVPTRAYLNQRSLPNGDVKCSVSSMAMVLAMNGLIASDYSTMAAKANGMYPNVLINGDAYIWKMRNVLRDEGAIADYHADSLDQGWARIKQEVDAGRPVIVRTVHGTVTAAGHILVAVGYREEGIDRRIIAYDPFGRWLGNCCQNNYNLNSTDSTSHKGRWVFYDFPRIFGNSNYLITVRNPNIEAILSAGISTPSTPPDQISDEPETVGTYEGANIEVGSELFLPLILQ